MKNARLRQNLAISLRISPLDLRARCADNILKSTYKARNSLTTKFIADICRHILFKLESKILATDRNMVVDDTMLTSLAGKSRSGSLHLPGGSGEVGSPEQHQHIE